MFGRQFIKDSDIPLFPEENLKGKDFSHNHYS
jgi:hypothetical protein